MTLKGVGVQVSLEWGEGGGNQPRLAVMGKTKTYNLACVNTKPKRKHTQYNMPKKSEN